MKKDVSTLSEIFLTALTIYLYGQEALVGIDLDENNRPVYTVNVPSCDLTILQDQYHAKDESMSVVPKSFAEAYAFVTKIQRQARNDGTWRSVAWQRGEVG
jgi:hypothetical protein